ncbi:hypothetical protein MO867_01595 [Microbulbifer sp. OS29]|uniref:Uncharacterized protein n=1 Tax=Microbulbifer okhotskensis TaxID=2926617 RepID=A0A9X2ENV8_9GAMM|nr:hypothetical protein [Microbulbifer okhotskensis]MCO1333023.1 hypothetical protein [Microbulbifer okhotskensis]
MRINYPSTEPHGEIRQLLPNFFYVPGTIKLAPGATINRNMGIARWGDQLTLINPVRLRPQQEEKLKDLGRVCHAIRLGYHHGQDDLYYRDRFNLTFWRQWGSNFYPPEADKVLRGAGPCPIPGGRIIAFSRSQFPEAVLWLPYNGGLLVSCDALQYWDSWHGCNWFGRSLLRFSGIRKGMQVVPAWRARVTAVGKDPGLWLEQDFQRILEQPFLHFLAAHGDFCADSAYELVTSAVGRAFAGVKKAA